MGSPLEVTRVVNGGLLGESQALVDMAQCPVVVPGVPEPIEVGGRVFSVFQGPGGIHDLRMEDGHLR